MPELGALGKVFNQDTVRFARIQRGLRASVRPSLTLSRYQESRIRHFHATLDAYLAQRNLERVFLAAHADEPIRDSTVASILKDAAARVPDHVALVAGTADPGKRVRRTYAEALAEAEAVARALVTRFPAG